MIWLEFWLLGTLPFFGLAQFTGARVPWWISLAAALCWPGIVFCWLLGLLAWIVELLGELVVWLGEALYPSA